MLKVTIFARLLVFLCLDVDLMAAYIQNGRCYFNKPYTTKIVSALRSCTRDCKINKACQAVVFDRYKKLCNFYDNQYDIKECPGKYLVLRNDIEEVRPFLTYIYIYISEQYIAPSIIGVAVENCTVPYHSSQTF